MKFLKLIRIQNLVLIALMQYVFRYTFMKTATYTRLLDSQNFLALTHFQFFLLVLSTVLIAAAGYIINDIMDQETDEIAKKRIIGIHISEKIAYNLYFAFNVTGVLIGFYLSNVIGKPSFASVFIVIAALLYIYATTLKQMAVIGNIVVAAILSMSILILGIFDLIPTTYKGNHIQMQQTFGILKDYAIFAFIINFIREIIKDIEDTDADYSAGIETLPVLIGRTRTLKITFALGIVAIGILTYYMSKNLFMYDIAIYYLLLFIIAPLLFFVIKTWNAKTQKDFKNLSFLLKMVLFFGILSIWVITYATTHA